MKTKHLMLVTSQNLWFPYIGMLILKKILNIDNRDKI